VPTTRKRPPAKPHPRSLDALFPVPKVQKCTRGHTQTPAWKRHHGCSTCRKQDAIAEVAKLEEVLAKAKAGEISSCAIAVVYRDGSSGRSWSKAHSITALQGSIALLSYAHSARYFED
jgi:hypothetical protein